MCQPPGLNFMKYYEYPQVGVLKFAVLVRTKQEFCSGVLLSDSWVLTAAHCVVQDERSAGDTGVTVKAGIIDKLDISGRSQERTSSEVVVYPDFKEKMISKFDIALIKVTEPFDLTTDSVDIVGISNQSWPLEPNFFRTCVGFGFGNIPSVDRSEPQRENQMRLKMWTTTAVHNKEACPCTKRFHWRRLICLRETDEIELCQGDGGGGLVCFEGPNPFKGSNHKDSIKKAELFGIAHMTMDKYMCMVTREPTPGCAKIPTISAYMYLCPFKSWLANYVPGVAFNTVSCQGSKLLDAAETMVLVTFLSLQYLFLIYN